VPAIISAGIYPGTSNVMAAEIISAARKEYDEQTGEYRTPAQGGPSHTGGTAVAGMLASNSLFVVSFKVMILQAGVQSSLVADNFMRLAVLPLLPPPGEGEEPQLLRYSYYTAGSGGAGPTILQASAGCTGSN
jgi:hypothetical protein